MKVLPWLSVPRMGSTRLRIGVAFSVLAIVLFGSVGLLSSRDARQQSERDTTIALQQLADRLAQRLDADMAARYRDIDQLTLLIDLMGLDPDTEQWRTLIERLQISSPHYSWIGVTDLKGQVQVASMGLLEKVDVQHRPWFAKGLKGTSVLDVHEAKLLASLLPSDNPGEPLRFVDVAAPLRVHGQLKGVVGVHLSWAWAEERRREAMAGDTANRGIEILLLNHDGVIELGPRSPELPTGAANVLQSLQRSAGMLSWSDRQRYLSAASASKPLADYPGMGWVVVVRQPEALALASATALGHRLLWLSLLGALLFGVLGWLLADRLTRPLRLVAAHAQALMASNEGPQPHDEVDQLAQSLASLLGDLKARETELRTLNAELESRVQERTASLQHANEDLRGFSRSVSHDIQGPLGSMSLLLRQTLQNDTAPLPEGTAQVMRMVAQECDRLRQLSAELLSLAMVEQRRLALEPVNHQALVQEVLDQLRMANPARFPEVVVGPLPTLPGDPVMLRQVWANLLSNAVKFTSQVAAPHIEVSVKQQGEGMAFTVADNGAGFDESKRQRLFGVFQRLHGASQFPGTGVGLSIVRRVVERHGGRVWAESPAGQGARFHFALPHKTPGSKPGASSPLPATSEQETETAHHF